MGLIVGSSASASGWQTALDLDFSAQSSQALGTIPLAIGEGYTMPPFEYVLPLPFQTLPDKSKIPPCAFFAAPGEPSQDDLYDNCMVLARYYCAQLGLTSGEADIDVIEVP